MALIAQPDFEFAAQDIQKLFAFMSITFTAPPGSLDAEQAGGIASICGEGDDVAPFPSPLILLGDGRTP